MVSRRMRAMASASSWPVGVSSVWRPVSAVGRLASSDLRKVCQRSVSLRGGAPRSPSQAARAARRWAGCPARQRTSSRVAPSLLTVPPCRSADARDVGQGSPTSLVEGASRPGSTTAPFGSDAMTLRSRAVDGHRAGRARGDHRTRRPLRDQALRLELHQSIPPRDRRDEPVRRQIGRPIVGDDLQEVDGDLPNARRIPPAHGGLSARGRPPRFR